MNVKATAINLLLKKHNYCTENSPCCPCRKSTWKYRTGAGHENGSEMSNGTAIFRSDRSNQTNGSTSKGGNLGSMDRAPGTDWVFFISYDEEQRGVESQIASNLELSRHQNTEKVWNFRKHKTCNRLICWCTVEYSNLASSRQYSVELLKRGQSR